MNNVGEKKVGSFIGCDSHDIFVNIISTENLYLSWKEFKKGKTGKKDVQEFALNLENNLFQLHEELKSKTYKHSHYTSFFINDPKRRHIHKASVRDRIVHHAVYRILYPIFDKTFIYDSYSCRNEKGTHKAVNRLQDFVRRGGPMWPPEPSGRPRRVAPTVIKMDIKKFFASVDHEILFDLIKEKIKDEDVLRLIKEIIDSFITKQNERERERESTKSSNRGIPLGNLTSQLFANIYLNELDRFVKHELKIKYYIRYCDDFVMLHSVGAGFKPAPTKDIDYFLKQHLKLQLHPNKIIIRKPNQGIDFLGYVVFSHHKVLRTKTKKRMFKKIKQKRRLLEQNKISLKSFRQTIMSYIGVCSHAEALGTRKKLASIYREEYKNYRGIKNKFKNKI